MVEGHAGPRQLRRLLDAVVSIGGELDLHTVLRRIVEAATELVDARYGALGVLDPEGRRLAQFLTVGVSGEQRRAIGDPPKGHGILGLLIVEPRPIRLPDLREHPDAFGFPPNHPPMRSFLGVPIKAGDRVFGNLYLADKQNDDVFTDVDEELVVALAAAAGVAIENARLHAQVADLALLEDRERIARDLHDTVIQRLFATGLSLQGAARLAERPEVARRIDAAVDDIDAVIREIRTTIFELHQGRGGASLRRWVLEVCAESSRPLGFDPVVHFDGPVDTVVPDEIAEHVVGVLREALANAARHARAKRVDVVVAVESAPLELHLEVVDDGVGLPPRGHEPGYGLRNIAQRAEAVAGTSSVASDADGGTTVRWTAPLVQRGSPAPS